MTDLLVRVLPARAQAINDRLRALLVATESAELIRLSETVTDIEVEAPYRIVTTGQYSAGKSKLLQALTGNAGIVSGADRTTSEVTAYKWGSVLLVDTPGVKAGLAEHDAKAEQALREADLVLFVVTVDLFDDRSAQHLRHVANDLGKLRDMVVVINKSGTLDAAKAIRTDAVMQALGESDVVPPIVIC